MGVLVERFLLSQLNDLRVRLQNEIQLLVRDEEEGVEEDSSSSYSYSSEDEDEPPQEVEP